MGSNHEPESDVKVDNMPPASHPGSLVTNLKFIPPPSLVPEGDLPPEGVPDGSSDMVPVGPDDPLLTHLDPILEDSYKPKVTVPQQPKRRYHKCTNPFHNKVRSGQYWTKCGWLVQPSAHLAGTYAVQQTPRDIRTPKSIRTYQYLANGYSNKKIWARTLLAEHKQGLDCDAKLASMWSFDSKQILHAMYRTLKPTF